jgi:hypothetical protein
VSICPVDGIIGMSDFLLGLVLAFKKNLTTVLRINYEAFVDARSQGKVLQDLIEVGP